MGLGRVREEDEKTVVLMVVMICCCTWFPSFDNCRVTETCERVETTMVEGVVLLFFCVMFVSCCLVESFFHPLLDVVVVRAGGFIFVLDGADDSSVTSSFLEFEFTAGIVLRCCC